MKTRLAERPKILGWMSSADKRFREKFPKLLMMLPLHSFLDQDTFKVEGYFVGKNIGSVVVKVRDEGGEYVVKSSLEKNMLLAEMTFLRAWQKVGANVVKVLEVIEPKNNFPIPVAILQYVPDSTTEERIEKVKVDENLIYKNLGEGLSILHKAKGKGFGEVKDIKKLHGRFKTFREERLSVLSNHNQKRLLRQRLVTQQDLKIIPIAIKIVEKSLSEKFQPSLLHNDAGLHNTFGIQSLKFFDPTPKISHPLEDLATALIWASFEDRPREKRELLITGYKSKMDYDERVLRACLFLRILEKWKWWLVRGKTEKHALGWINKTKGLFRETKKFLV